LQCNIKLDKSLLEKLAKCSLTDEQLRFLLIPDSSLVTRLARILEIHLVEDAALIKSMDTLTVQEQLIKQQHLGLLEGLEIPSTLEERKDILIAGLERHRDRKGEKGKRKGRRLFLAKVLALIEVFDANLDMSGI
jgi:hypothetical protein